MDVSDHLMTDIIVCIIECLSDWETAGLRSSSLAHAERIVVVGFKKGAEAWGFFAKAQGFFPSVFLEKLSAFNRLEFESFFFFFF